MFSLFTPRGARMLQTSNLRVVCVSGMFCNEKFWEPLIGNLSKLGIEVTVAGTFSRHNQSERVNELLRNLSKHKKTIFLGHSAGGETLWQIAANASNEKQQMIEKYIFVSTTLESPTKKEILRKTAFIKMLRSCDEEAFEKIVSEPDFFTKQAFFLTKEQLLILSQMVKTIGLPTCIEHLEATLERQDKHPNLRNIIKNSGSVTFLHGEDDQIFTPQNPEALLTKLKKLGPIDDELLASKLRIVPPVKQCGHLLPMEKLMVLVEEILRENPSQEFESVCKLGM